MCLSFFFFFLLFSLLLWCVCTLVFGNFCHSAKDTHKSTNGNCKTVLRYNVVTWLLFRNSIVTCSWRWKILTKRILNKKLRHKMFLKKSRDYGHIHTGREWERHCAHDEWNGWAVSYDYFFFFFGTNFEIHPSFSFNLFALIVQCYKQNGRNKEKNWKEIQQ